MQTTTTKESTVWGLAATPEAIAKLRLIAAHQTVSPVTDPRYYEDINFEPDFYKALPTTPPKVDLQTFMASGTFFFAQGLEELPEEDQDDYLDWSADLLMYTSKFLCDATQAEIGDVFGKTKGQVKAVRERIERHILKQAKKGDHALLMFLNEFRHLLMEH